jgi:NTE family protein
MRCKFDKAAGQSGQCRVRFWILILLLLTGMLAVGGCASVYNYPGNQPLLSATAVIDAGRLNPPTYDDDVLVALSFSGGGTRAAAFSFGVLQELDRVRSGSTSTKSLLDRAGFVSGVSGGAITAAYFGLRKREALRDFREKFLLRNAEENLRTGVSMANIGRALGGGVNDNQFSRWLDENLFDGATFGSFGANPRPWVWINASDIYNHTPFVFGPLAFSALCSDIRSYKVADAVAASAAVPLAFAPIVLETYPGCSARMPDWIERARHNPEAQPLLRSFAEAIARYQDGSMKYVKLLDGGLVDNFGLAGISIGMLAAQRPYEPMTERQAAHVRRMMFVVVDAGRGLSGNWANRLEGPNGVELVSAAADTAIDASVRSSFTAFSGLISEWTARVQHWRCGLSEADLARLALPVAWKCNDVNMFVDRVSFERLGPARASVLDAIATRLVLPSDQVDLLIESGAEALRSSPQFQLFRRGL